MSDNNEQRYDDVARAYAGAACEACGVAWVYHLGIQGTCAELIKARLEIEELKRRLVVPCRQCGAPVEEVRKCYATPVCYRCLPPPKPLPTITLGPKM